MFDSNYVLFEKAKNLSKRKDYVGAIIIFRNILKSEPNDRIVKFELARALAKTSEGKQEAKELLIQLLSTQNRTYAMLELGKLEASEGNNAQARSYFEQLLSEQNRNRTYAMLELGKLEAREGNNAKARSYFEQLLFTSGKLSDRNYAMLELGKLEASEDNDDQARSYFEQLLSDPSKICRESARANLLFLNIKENKFRDAYDLMSLVCSTTISNMVYKSLKIYLEYELGLIDDYSEYKGYFASQLFDYDENKALEHIKLHLDENEQKRKHSVFNNDIDLAELLHIVQEKIKNLNPREYIGVDKYIVDCGMCVASFNSGDTQYATVITLPNSKNILTMYPELVSKSSKAGKVLCKVKQAESQ